ARAAEEGGPPRGAARRPLTPRQHRPGRRRGARRRRRRAGIGVRTGGARAQEKNLMTDRVIEINNLTVRYGRKAAVDNVSINVDRGVVYALLGRNGAGKSSLIRCLLGQLRPDGGALRLF